MTRPCMNPASFLFPERDEPMVSSRDNGRPLTAQKKPRPRGWDQPVKVLNRDWTPPKFIGHGDDDGDE